MSTPSSPINSSMNASGSFAPDLSALLSPGSQAAPPASAPVPATGAPAPTDSAAVQAQMAPFQQKEQAAYGKASDLANQPTTTVPPPHQRLLAMVSGLATGLSAAGTSLATHGQEGGAKEVQQIRAAQVQQQQQAHRNWLLLGT